MKNLAVKETEETQDQPRKRRSIGGAIAVYEKHYRLIDICKNLSAQIAETEREMLEICSECNDAMGLFPDELLAKLAIQRSLKEAAEDKLRRVEREIEICKQQLLLNQSGS